MPSRTVNAIAGIVTVGAIATAVVTWSLSDGGRARPAAGSSTAARASGGVPPPPSPSPSPSSPSSPSPSPAVMVDAPDVAPDTHPAPIELFAESRLGDWYAYRVDNAGSLGEIRTTALAWVSAASADVVSRRWRGKIDATGEERSGGPDDFPRVGLTVERLTGLDVGGWTISDLTVTEAVRLIAGHSFACKKLSFASSDPLFPRKRTHTELWISREVPGGGLVASREEQHLDDKTFVITEEVTGFGTASRTIWGTRPAGW